MVSEVKKLADTRTYLKDNKVIRKKDSKCRNNKTEYFPNRDGSSESCDCGSK